MLELKNITYVADDKVILDDISLIIDKKELFIITGPNGSGKSTLAKIIMGLIKPTKGKILFNEIDITDYSVDKRANLGINFTFQNPIAFNGLTVKDLMEISLEYEIDFDTASHYLSEVGLCAREYLDRAFDKTLSGGEKKRIELAVALLRDSLLTIYDEPEAGIDLWSFEKLTEIFKKIREEKKEITIIISHQEKLIKMADEIILLEKGKIKSRGNNVNFKGNKCHNCKEVCSE